MRPCRVAICLILLSAPLAMPTPAASQEDAPSFADSVAVLRQVGLRVGRQLGPVRIAPRLACVETDCPESYAEEGEPSRLVAHFRAAVETGTPPGRLDGMPVVRPTPYVTASMPRFDATGRIAGVQIRVEDAWGPPVVTRWLLRRAGEAWEVTGTSGIVRPWPLDRDDRGG